MWDPSINTSDPRVQMIKQILIQNGLVDVSEFDIAKNFHISAGVGATHYPILFLVDISGSLQLEVNNLNRAIRDFIPQILDSRTTLSSSIDFSIVTFSNQVKVRRGFGYITEKDRNAAYCSISDLEIGGNTHMASALFVAWYLAQARKEMYKEKGIMYKPPIIVLISDLRNTEGTKIPENSNTYFINEMISLYNTLQNAHKLGLIKALFGEVYSNCDRALQGIKVGDPKYFADTLKTIFSNLIATITDTSSDKKHLTFDEDDDILILDDTLSMQSAATQKEANDMVAKLSELFNKGD